VSTHEQGKDGNLQAQRHELVRLVQEQGGIPLRGFGFEWSGHGPDWLKKLEHVGRYSRRFDAPVVVLMVDRLIRAATYWSTNDHWGDQATDEEIAQALQALDCRVQSVLPQGASAAECHAYRIRLGQRHKDAPGGRPPTPPRFDFGPGHRKERHDHCLDQVLEWAAADVGINEIARRFRKEKNVSVSAMTVSRWVDKYLKDYLAGRNITSRTPKHDQAKSP
jgi:hypothetical protein